MSLTLLAFEGFGWGCEITARFGCEIRARFALGVFAIAAQIHRKYVPASWRLGKSALFKHCAEILELETLAVKLERIAPLTSAFVF